MRVPRSLECWRAVLVRAAITAWSLAPAATWAQSPSGPVFLLQPGLLSADFISAGPDVSSTTGFNLRFETRFPTRTPWLTPLVGEEVVDAVALAARIDRRNQGRGRQESLVARLLRESVEDEAGVQQLQVGWEQGGRLHGESACLLPFNRR